MEAKEVSVYIQKNFDVNYSVSGATALLHSTGFTYKKAKEVPGKADAEELFILEYMRIKSKSDRKIYFAGPTPFPA